MLGISMQSENFGHFPEIECFAIVLATWKCSRDVWEEHAIHSAEFYDANEVISCSQHFELY